MHPISDRVFLAGALRAPRSEVRITVLNPSTGQPLGEIPDGTAADVDDAVAAAAGGGGRVVGHPGTGAGGRCLRGSRGSFASTPKGSRASTARTAGGRSPRPGPRRREAPSSSNTARERRTSSRGRVVPLGSNVFAATVLEPYGVIGALTPWNAPLLQIAQKTSHALAAGNTVVVKPSPLACFSTLHYAVLAGEAGLPAGVLNVVTGGAGTGQALVADGRVDKVTFTGSTATGRQIAGVCGARGASVALELGGKCPLLVFADADLEQAAGETARAAFGTTGQSCVSAARILVESACYDEFTKRLVEASAGFAGGDPFAPGTVMGPLISAGARERVHGLVADARETGARLAGGSWPPPAGAGGGGGDGERGGDGGFFMNPVLLADVPEAARIRREEIFGPVTCLERFEDEGEAIESANAGPYGLAAGAYTGSVARARRLQRGLKAGNVWINCYKMLDPALPFGGDKASGIARECGIDGVLNFVKPKALVDAFPT